MRRTSRPVPPAPNAPRRLITLVALLAFDPAVITTDLASDARRAGALRHLFDLDASALAVARSAPLASPVAEIAANDALPFDERVLATRALALLGDRATAESALTPIVVRHQSPEHIALAREATRTLAQLRLRKALEPALTSPDPDIRATAARAGPAPHDLCRMALDDAWPRVRAAAARGLADHGQTAGCLVSAVGDHELVVALAAVQTIARARPDGVHQMLLSAARSGRTPVAVRVEAIVALGALGHPELPRAILDALDDETKIAPLAEASIRALALHADPTDKPRLRHALDAATPGVQMAAVRAVAALGDRGAIPTLEAIYPMARAHHQLVIDKALLELGATASAPPEDDPAADDPE